MQIDKRDAQCGVMRVWPDAARRVGLGRNAIYEAIARGEIEVLRFGRRIVVPNAVIDRMLGIADGSGAQAAIPAGPPTFEEIVEENRDRPPEELLEAILRHYPNLTASAIAQRLRASAAANFREAAPERRGRGRPRKVGGEAA